MLICSVSVTKAASTMNFELFEMTEELNSLRSVESVLQLRSVFINVYVIEKNENAPLSIAP